MIGYKKYILASCLGWMSKPVGKNTVAFHTGEVGHGLEAVRKGGGVSGIENGGKKFFRNASN